jgi:E3 ubiquitin-protein ligase DOA10
MREVKIKVVDVRNPTHRVLKLDEPKAEEYNNLSSSDEKSQIQVGSNTELEMDGDLEGEEVKIERTTGEKVPERKDMSRTTPMDGKSNWPKASKNYEFDATLKKTRNQLDILKAPVDPFIPLGAAKEVQAATFVEVEKWLEENIDPIIKEKSEVGALSIKLDTQIINKFVGEFGGSLKGAWELIQEHYLKKGNYTFGPGYTINWEHASEFDLNL